MINWRFWKRVRPEHDPTSLGRILVDNGLISDEELVDALEIQKQRRKRDRDIRLGEILVEIKAVEQGIIEAVLHIQEAQRKKDVGTVVDLVCEQSRQVIHLQDHFINDKAKA